MSINKVILIGHLGQDPEIKSIQQNVSVCNINVATSETWKDQTGNTVKKTEWHKVVLWKKLAEFAAQYLKKGSQVYIEGRIQSREYDDSSGTKRKVYEIIANDLKLLDKKQS